MKRQHVQEILRKPLERLWTVQGFGKMSTNVTPTARLHIWDRMLLDPRVPAVHSHAYDFRSVVLAGRVRNIRMHEVAGDAWNKVLVSASAGIVQEPEVTALQEDPVELYDEGAVYSQTDEEIHWSVPDDGSVTLVEWEFGPSPKHMKVFWRGRSPWKDAKAREATQDEVVNVTQAALDLWF